MIDKKTLIKINAIDVNYRDIEDFDLQFDVMKYILNCLSDKQLDTTKKLIEVTKVFEKNKKKEEK
jgi:hypothetical protein